MDRNTSYTGVSSRDIEESSSFIIGENNQTSNIPGLHQTLKYTPTSHIKPKEKKKGLISKFLSNMSRLGMNYDEQVINNMRALPADKNLIPKPDQLTQGDIWSQLTSSWKVKSNKDKNFFEKDFQQKRDALRKLAVQPELEDILDTMSNEAIVYDSDYTYFADPFIEAQELKDLKKSVQDKIKNKLSNNYRRFYKYLNWKYNAWDDFKRFLVEGELAWEIVYDKLDKPTKIIGLIPLDVATLTRKFDNNKYYWIQFKGMQGRERTLLDSQVVYISYQETNCISRVSYLERLIRPFNIYRIVEQAQLIWTITNSSYKMKFTIPVRGLSRAAGMQTVNAAMNRYKEDIKFIGDTGELTINGQVNMPFNKEYWFPEGDSGSPSIESLGGDGPDLNDNDQLKYFKNQLYKVSKIPLNRFDQESGETWFGTDASSVARTEIDFARFVNRLRNQFSQIIIKPLQIQLAMDIPELVDNRELLEAVSLQYKSYNLFEEMMELELMQKRVEFIQTMKDSMTDMDVEGNDVKFFSSEFLVQKYLKLSQADLDLNDKLKQEEIAKLNLAGDETIDTEDDLSSLIDNPDASKVMEAKVKSKKKKKQSKRSDHISNNVDGEHKEEE